MTYNIYDGGKEGLEPVIEAVKDVSPDFLTINEANGFEEKRKLEYFAKKTKMPYYKLSLCGEEADDALWHVAVFSRLPFKEVREIKPLMRAGILAVIDSNFGEIAIIGAHLAPFKEDMRITEVDLIAKELEKYPNRVLMGDMNALSPDDGYEEDLVKGFNEIQLAKFTRRGILNENKLLFDAIRKIKKLGYIDAALLFGKEKEFTAPTAIKKDSAHNNMRLDYIFISEFLKNKVKDYEVVKNELTEKASDHYPVVVELGE